MSEKFIEYNSNIHISNAGRKATNIASIIAGASVYGAIRIKNNTQKIYKWTIKCLRCSDIFSWAIGIADATLAHYDGNFDHRENTYSYRLMGHSFSETERKNKATSGWDAGDILTLVYNGTDRKLSLLINGTNQTRGDMSIKHNAAGYKFAAFLCTKSDALEIMDFVVTGSGDDDEKKDSMQMEELQVNDQRSKFCFSTNFVINGHTQRKLRKIEDDHNVAISTIESLKLELSKTEEELREVQQQSDEEKVYLHSIQLNINTNITRNMNIHRKNMKSNKTYQPQRSSHYIQKLSH